MREIKFRAWDTKTKKMIFTGFHIIGEVTCFELIYRYCWENKEEDEPTLGRLNDIELMQYVGLKDCKDVEIYEGDLLRFNNDYSVPPSEVRWWVYEWVSFRYSTTDKNHWYRNSLRQYASSEVIGNIYENPELLGADAEKK